MSSLFALLGLGSAGLQAQHAGAAVATNNAANVNTRGYSRQRIDLRENLAAPLVGGVSTGTPQRMASDLLESRARAAYGDAGRSGARAPALLDLEAAMGGATSVDVGLGELWAGLQRVAAMPTDSVVRDAAIAAARSLADGIRERAEAVAKARDDADARVRESVDRASELARQIAESNRQLRASGGDPAAADRRDVAAADLAALVGGEGHLDANGEMRWVLPDGGVLIDGDRASSLEATRDPTTGFHKVELVSSGGQRRDVTSTLDGGSIGGDLAFRDVDAAATATDLDQFAYDLTTVMNAAHRNGAGLDGVGGRDLFVGQAAVAGAASRMTVDPAIVADSRKLGAGTVGAGPGDNRGALGLLALRDQRVAGGGTRTLGDAAIDLTARVGREAAAAGAQQARDGEVADHVAGLRDAVSGVDLDEELSTMVQFQHASEAMTRFLSTVDSMLGDLLQRL